MFEKHFNLDGTPFSKGVPSGSPMTTEAVEDAPGGLQHVVDRRLLGVVTGGRGRGETTPLQVIKESMDCKSRDFVYLDPPPAFSFKPKTER